MNKIITLLMCVVLYTSNMQAQQIEGDFEVWEDCYPDGKNLVGKQPVGWTVSNVFQSGVKKEFISLDASGRTGNCVKAMNDFVGLGSIGANAPAFVTLGKMWVFADAAGMLFKKDKSDGGVYGGINFACRPDSLTLYYKRKLGTEKPNETAKVLIYMWKGTFKSKVINGHTPSSGKVTYKEIIDQERAVLNKEPMAADTPGDGILIASAEYTIDKSTEEDKWERLSIPINYVEGENGKLTPEKMNIVFSGCNYWVRADIGKENTLWVDDAALAYNSKLESLSIGGTLLEGFKKDTYIYMVDELPAEDDITAISDGKGALVEISAGETFVKIVVTGNDGAPNQHVYTLVKKGTNFSATSIKLNDVDIENFDPTVNAYENLSMPNGIYPTVSVASDPILTTVDMRLNDVDKTVTIVVRDKVNNSDHTYTLKFTSSDRIANGPQIKGDFEVQTPWGPDMMNKERFGTVADGWFSSNVIQMGSMKFVMVEKESHGDGNAVKMINGRPGLSTAVSNAPGYITLGTPWVYADVLGLLTETSDEMPIKNDKDDSNGGTIGGVSFTYQPDSIVGYYKRTYATSELDGMNPNENAKIIAYLWRGTSASMAPATAPGFEAFGAPTGSYWQLLIDRDIDILGTKNGGTPAEGIKLVASAEKTVNELADWTRISVPLHYVSDEKPEKANVVISSADYFNRANIGNGNTLSADDVVFVYNSKLKSITIDGTELEGFDKNTYSYNSTDEVPALADIEAKADGKGAIVDIVINDNVVTITVKGNDSAENPGNIHTYTLTYKKTVGIEQNTADAIKVTSKESGFIVEGVAADERVIVYTVQGSLVGQYVANGTLTVDGLMPKTIYIVKVGSNVQRVLTK